MGERAGDLERRMGREGRVMEKERMIKADFQSSGSSSWLLNLTDEEISSPTPLETTVPLALFLECQPCIFYKEILALDGIFIRL